MSPAPISYTTMNMHCKQFLSRDATRSAVLPWQVVCSSVRLSRSRIRRRRLEAQTTLRGHKIFARKICIKNQQNARILHNNCPKNIFPEF